MPDMFIDVGLMDSCREDRRASGGSAVDDAREEVTMQGGRPNESAVDSWAVLVARV